MSETDRIRQQMKQAFEGEAWHGPALLQILDGVDADVAARSPMPGAHSIWEIVLHLTGTQHLMLRRMRGDQAALELPLDQDWPPVPEPTEANWGSTLAALKQGEEALRHALQGLPETQLDMPLIEGTSSAYNNLHGYVQHNVYHAGQISLLKKVGLQAHG